MLDWEVIQKYLPLFEDAALLTVKIGVIGIIFSIIVGVICAAIRYYKVPVLRQIARVYAASIVFGSDPEFYHFFRHFDGIRYSGAHHLKCIL